MENRLAAAPQSYSRLTAAPQLPAAHGTNLDRIKKVSEEFESVFLTNMFEEMFSNVEEEEGPFGGGASSEAWRSMRVEEFAKTISSAGGIGLAAHVQRHLIAMQESKP